MSNIELSSNFSERLAFDLLNYEKYSPFFSQLYENKIVYHERFTCIARLENINITSEMFEATAVPLMVIEKGNRFDKMVPTESWRFGARWFIMNYDDNWLTAYYAGWNIWCDAELVKKVEQFIFEKKYKEALNLTLYK